MGDDFDLLLRVVCDIVLYVQNKLKGGTKIMARPLKENEPRNKRIEIRLTAGELSDIDFVAKASGMTRTEAIIETMSYRADEIMKNQQKMEREK